MSQRFRTPSAPTAPKLYPGLNHLFHVQPKEKTKSVDPDEHSLDSPMYLSPADSVYLHTKAPFLNGGD